MVNGVEVLLYDVLTLFAVGFLDGGLYLLDCLIPWQHAAYGKETGLHYCVDANAHSGVPGHFVGVYHEELQALLYYALLQLQGQVLPYLVGAEGGVEEEGCAFAGVLENIVFLDEHSLVAGNEVRAADEAGVPDGTGAEPEVAHGEGAGFLRVVDEVSLGIVVGGLTYDLDAVLVCAYGAVGAQSKEDRLVKSLFTQFELGYLDAGVGYVVVDAHGEAVLLPAPGVVENGEDPGWAEFLAGKAIAASENLHAAPAGVVEGGYDILVEGFAVVPRFLRPVEDAYGLHGFRYGGEEGGSVEGAVEAHLDNADLFPFAGQVFNGFMGHFAAGAHEYHYMLGIRGADIVEEPVVPAGELSEEVHVFLDDPRCGVVVGIHRFPALEVDIGVLAGSPEDRAVGIEAPLPVAVDQLVVDHLPEGVVFQGLYLLYLVAGPEAVEEVDEGDPALQCGGVGDGAEVGYLLNAAACKKAESGVPYSHHIAVVAEDGESLTGKASG